MTTTSTSGRSSRISRPHDPLPSRTSGSSYGCTSVRPRSARSSSRRWSDSPTCAPWRTTSAPYSRQAATFDATAPAGITTVIGTPASRAAHAYAWPALPAEIVIAPRRRSSGVSEAIRASAARGLNEPVFWRCSALRYRRPSARTAPELWPGDPGRRRGRQHRRVVDPRAQQAAGLADRGQGDGAVAHGASMRERRVPARGRRAGPSGHRLRLGDLEQVAATVLEHREDHRTHVGGLLREPYAVTLEPL